MRFGCKDTTDNAILEVSAATTSESVCNTISMGEICAAQKDDPLLTSLCDSLNAGVSVPPQCLLSAVLFEKCKVCSLLMVF